MNRLRTPLLARLLAAVSLGVVMLAASAGAQQWQAADGGLLVEDGRGGVAPLANGTGYISVGHTTSFSPTADVYVVQTNLVGGIVWAFAYDFGNSSEYGHDIHECANGDFVITGYTNTAGNNDLFILRINAAGGFLWVQLYGGPNEEQGMDILEAANGDIVAAGWSDPVVGNRDGLIVRLTVGGANIFVQTYAPAGGGANEYFHGLWEAANGDLLACGASTSFGNGNQGLVMRATGGGAPIWTQHIGLAAAEELNSVIELAVGAQAGNIVAVGSTTGTPPIDFYVVKYTGGGVMIAPDVTGGTSAGSEEVYQVRELGTGNIILAGRMNPGPLGGEDGYAIEMTPAWACPAGKAWTMVYGGATQDRLYSAQEDPANCIPGIIMCGLTTSPGLVPAGDPQQHYLIKTNVAGVSGCNEKAPSDRCTQPNYPSQNAPLVVTVRPPVFARTSLIRNANVGAVLCFTACPGPKRNLPDEVGAPFSLASAYPNPVRAGSTFQVEYNLGGGGEATVVIADIVGRVVFAERGSTNGGIGSMAIDTRGWAAGIYLVKVDLGSEVVVRRIVVE